MSISSTNKLNLPTEFKFAFNTTVNSYYIRHHSESELEAIFAKKKSKIIVFPSEKLLSTFLILHRKKYNLIHFKQSKLWYPHILIDPRLIILATLSDVKGISFPFSNWIFYEMNPNVFKNHSRSEGENIFLHN